MLQKLYLDSRCNICGDNYFGTPKFLKGVLLSTLSCGHTFHRNCAIDKQDEQTKNNQTLKCVNCEAVVDLIEKTRLDKLSQAWTSGGMRGRAFRPLDFIDSRFIPGVGGGILLATSEAFLAGFIGAVFGKSLGARIAGITGSYAGSVIGLLAGVAIFTNRLANGESFWDNRHVRDVKGMIGGAVYVARALL